MADEFSDPIDPLDIPFGVNVPNEEDMSTLIAKSAALEKAFDVAVSYDNQHLAKKRAELDENAAGAAHGLEADAHARALITTAAQKKADMAFHQFAAGVRNLSQPNRDEMIKQLDAARQKADVVLKLFPTPVQLLSATALGSEERNRYTNQVAHIGRMELLTYARLAITNNNPTLGAAVLARLDSLPRDQRPFPAAKFAEQLVGPRHAALTKGAKMVAATFQRVVNQNRDHERGKTNLNTRISDALTLNNLTK